MYDRHANGQVSELYVMYQLALKGYRVVPAFGYPRWDLIIEKDSPPIRVQVKSVLRKGDEIKVGLRGNGNTSYYTSNEVDVIAVHERQDNVVYYIPIREVEGKSSILLRLAPPPSYVHPKTRYARDYVSLPDSREKEVVAY